LAPVTAFFPPSLAESTRASARQAHPTAAHHAPGTRHPAEHPAPGTRHPAPSTEHRAPVYLDILHMADLAYVSTF